MNIFEDIQISTSKRDLESDLLHKTKIQNRSPDIFIIIKKKRTNLITFTLLLKLLLKVTIFNIFSYKNYCPSS